MKTIKFLSILLLLVNLSNSGLSQNYWTGLNGPYSGNVLDIKKHSTGNLYIIRSEAAYVSSNNGNSWTEFDNASLGSNNTLEITPSGTIYLGKSSAGLWWTLNGGQTWSFNPIHIAPHSGQWLSVITLAISPNGVVYANNYRSFNGGSNFSSFTISQGAFPNDYAFNPSGNAFVAASNGVYRSNDHGNTWTNISSNLPQTSFNKIIYENENSILVSVHNSGIFKTTNAGANWNAMNNGLTDLNISELYLKDGKIFAGTESSKLFVSSNSGNSWSLISDVAGAGKINSIFNDGNEIFLGTSLNGVNYSQDNGANWETKNQNLFLASINDLAFGENEIFAASRNGIFYSSDEGNTWSKRNHGLPSYLVTKIYKSNNDVLFVSVLNNGVFSSTDNGNTWSPSNTGINSNFNVNYFGETEGYLYALSINSFDTVSLFRSSNNGSFWENVFTRSGFFLHNITIDTQDKIYIGGLDSTFQSVLYSSVDDGLNWTSINYQKSQLRFENLSSAGLDLYMTDAFNILKSTNGGDDWFEIPNGNWGNVQLNLMNVNSRGDIFLIVNNSIYLTTNNGNSWVERISGLPANSITTNLIFDSKGFLYNVTSMHGIFHSIESTLTGVTISQNELPVEYKLYQNFPNPFNPETKIRFNIPSDKFVTLYIYDISGRRIKTLVNENLSSGNYSVTFDASQLSSGVYFYELLTYDFRESKKMILLR